MLQYTGTTMKTALALCALVFTATCDPLSFLQQEQMPPDTDWPSYAGSLASDKHADLDQVNADTVKDLSIAWVWNSVDNEAVKVRPKFVPLAFKSTPIKIGNVLYTSTSLEIGRAHV